MEIPFDLSTKHNEHWIIGVSGGPDSMALLAMAHQAEIICHVIHINYHKRETALRDQNLVEDYCASNNIDLQVIDAPTCPKGNFQGWARDFRYQKMIERCHAVKAKGIMSAHHKDDDLETYLLQTRRKSKVTWYGLKSEVRLKEMRLVRPLLHFWKSELESYCLKNGIQYGIDESNFSSDYLRNRIRKELGTLSLEQKIGLYQEKESRNLDRQSRLDRFGKFLSQDTLEISDYLKCIEEWSDFLFEWLRVRTQIQNLSNSYMQELRRQLVQSPSVLIRLNSRYRLIKQYGSIRLIPNPVHYSYQLPEPIQLDTPFFKCSVVAKERYEKIEAEASEYPLTVCNAKGDERYLSDGGIRKLSRWFITHKIPFEIRETWPLVYNAQNELIFIPRCKVKRNAIYANKSLYMLK